MQPQVTTALAAKVQAVNRLSAHRRLNAVAQRAY
jgi:hypothetical protein